MHLTQEAIERERMALRSEGGASPTVYAALRLAEEALLLEAELGPGSGTLAERVHGKLGALRAELDRLQDRLKASPEIDLGTSPERPDPLYGWQPAYEDVRMVFDAHQQVTDAIGHVVPNWSELAPSEIRERSRSFLDATLERVRIGDFLVPEFQDRIERLERALSAERGGPPKQDGSNWNLTWQFQSDVWSPYDNRMKLMLHACANDPAAARRFAGELRDWADFIERTVDGP